MPNFETYYWSYVGYLALLSLITFIAYAIDKFNAKRNARRVPEKILLLLSFFGGAYGGFIGMQLFRHKTKREHWYFSVINVVAIIIHTYLLIKFFPQSIIIY